jgi:hypothetical protein
MCIDTRQSYQSFAAFHHVSSPASDRPSGARTRSDGSLYLTWSRTLPNAGSSAPSPLMPTTLMKTSAFAAPVTLTHADTLTPVVPTPTEGPVAPYSGPRLAA